MTENPNYEDDVIDDTDENGDVEIVDEDMYTDPDVDIDWDGEPGSMSAYATDDEPPLEADEEGTE